MTRRQGPGQVQPPLTETVDGQDGAAQPQGGGGARDSCFGFLEDAVLVDVLVLRVVKRFAEDNKVISVLQECIREGTEEQNPVSRWSSPS